MDPSDPDLGTVIRRRREELGLSIREASTRAGLTRRTWTEIEHGQRSRVRTHTLNAIDRVLGRPAGTLVKALGRSDVVKSRVVVELMSRAGETSEDLRARSHLARLAADLSVTDVYRVLAYVDRLPDRRVVEDVQRTAAVSVVAQMANPMLPVAK